MSLNCDPDCLTCLRLKLNADSIVVFFKDHDSDSWRLGGFQGEKPSNDMEVEVYRMLITKMPQTVAIYKDGLLLSSQEEIETMFPETKKLFTNSSIIAAPVFFNKQNEELTGVRAAWRHNNNPFTAKDLETLRCTSACPQI